MQFSTLLTLYTQDARSLRCVNGASAAAPPSDAAATPAEVATPAVPRTVCEVRVALSQLLDNLLDGFQHGCAADVPCIRMV